MKKIFLFILIFLSSNLYAQTWSSEIPLTKGFNDINPHFGSKRFPGVFIMRDELLVFERKTSTTSNICMLKAGVDSIERQVTYVTNDIFENLNPSVAYGKLTPVDKFITRALIAWQSLRNGKWGIFAKAYTAESGWSQIFAIDTAGTDKLNPDVFYYGADLFAIVYENNGDIQYKHINVLNFQNVYSVNLTQTDTAFCSYPRISGMNGGNSSRVLVTYNRRKLNNQNDVYSQRMLTNAVWSGPDTVTVTSNNKNSGIVLNHFGGLTAVYERYENNKWVIKGTSIGMNNSSASQTDMDMIPSSIYSTKNFDNYFYPIFTDNLSQTAFYNIGAYTYKTNDSLKMKLLKGNFNSASDSLSLGDSSKNSTLTVNNGIFYSPYAHIVWVVYSKDSLTFSNLYAKRIFVYTNSIEQIGSNIPGSFNLYQNYPNPFNPSTNIQFDIPKNESVKVVIYDMLGKEIAILVNEELPAGKYNFIWNADNTPSGIYFCKMFSGEFTKTTRMVLVK